MPEIFESITPGSLDPALTSLSFLIALFGSWCALICAARARRRAALRAVFWVLAAAVALGGGAIWSMHFIGILADRTQLAYTLDMKTTLLSLVIALGSSAIGMAIAAAAHGVPGYVFGGLVTGGGVAAMHYTGIYAMTMNGTVSYRRDLIAASVAIAVVAASLSLFFALRVGRSWGRALAAVVMGVGVCGMHYVGMAAVTTTPSHDLDLGLTRRGLDPFSLAMPIFGICSVVLLILLVAGFFDDTSLEDEQDDLDAELEPVV